MEFILICLCILLTFFFIVIFNINTTDKVRRIALRIEKTILIILAIIIPYLVFQLWILGKIKNYELAVLLFAEIVLIFGYRGITKLREKAG